MILYDEQRKVVDKLMYFLPKYKFQLLTGEVGSGKTYMGSEIAKRYAVENKRVLIVSPRQVVNKWNEVLKLTFEDNELYLENVVVSSNIAKEDLFDDYDLVIYDEIHLIKSRIRYLKEMRDVYPVEIVGLTGSIVDKDVSDITNLTNQFADKFYDMYSKSVFSTRYAFVRLFVQTFIAHGLSRDNIKTEVENTEAIVNVHELSVKMNAEESAFYKFASRRMDSIGLSETRQIKLLNETLDRVTKSSTFSHKGLQYFVGERLVEKSSDKINQLKATLETIDENALIYVTNGVVGREIEKQLNNCIFIDVTQNIEDAEKTVNHHLINGKKHVIINITKVTTGIDLHANHLIWYQTPMKLTQDIQGTGRITRLSSSNEEKHVYYLYHHNTKQEKLVKILKRNRELNNEMIKKQQTTNVSTIPFQHLLKG